MGLGIIAGLLVAFVFYGALWAIRRSPDNPVFGERDRRPRPEPDPSPERLQAAGLPPSPRFQVGASTPENLGGILGSGTPSLGPAPPSIGYEPEENTIRVDASEPPAFHIPGLGEE
jgi:hypothetical protein